MSDTVKLIVTLSKGQYENLKNIQCGSIGARMIVNAVMNGIPLDDVKAEIEQNAYPIVHGVNNHEKGMTLYGILQVLDNIGKAESEDI